MFRVLGFGMDFTDQDISYRYFVKNPDTNVNGMQIFISGSKYHVSAIFAPVDSICIS